MDCNDLDLGILEFGYTSRDGRLRSGLEFTLSLARVAEECGYSRFWFTEHHGPELQIACPEVVIASVAAQTKRIRVGSAGILLGYYSPFKVAEVFHTLSTLFPDRIDLGLARGAGGAPETTDLLRDGQAKPADMQAAEALFERKTRDLIAHLRSGHEAQRKIESAMPLPGLPQLWQMGSGTGSAKLAARLGMRLCMALWYQREESVDVRAVLADYASRFQPAPELASAIGCLSLSGICAETDAEAQRMLAAVTERFGGKPTVNFCGSPERCRETILDLAARHAVREVVIHAQYCEDDQQERMFRLLADAMLPSRRRQILEPARRGPPSSELQAKLGACGERVYA
jgi:luciferase family oxidoreductase group 1